MKKNFLNGSIYKDPTIIRSMTDHYELNEFVKVAPNSLFTQEQIFYIHAFSSNYGIRTYEHTTKVTRGKQGKC